MNLFRKRQYVPINTATRAGAENEPFIPDGLWIKCPVCGKIIYKKELDEHKICPFCDGVFRLGSRDRIKITADEGSFVEMDESLTSGNPLSYPGYESKIEKLKVLTDLNDAVISGICTIDGKKAVLCVMDSNFIMGSMGSVVGEKITRAFEYSLKEKLPIVIFTASGGARMQEGIISLMQMAKVGAAVKRHSDAGLLYITVLTDPTTGGVTASFAMLGDVILSEPRALIGFAGRRVIEQTIKENLPEDFQTADFLLEHGFIDAIVERFEMKKVISKILSIHSKKTYKNLVSGGGLNG